LAGAGATVALVARRGDRLEALAEELEKDGGRALPIQSDITDEAQARSAIEKAQSELGRLDVLVNNAGVMLLGPIQGADTAEWRRMVDVNVMGLLYCTYYALPVMRDQGGGHIVNISSVAGRTASLGVGVYNATKWAVGAFSESLRQEALHLNVRVTIVEPGMVVTELQEHTTNEMARQAMDRALSETKAPLQAEDIAEAIFYAVSQPPHVNVNEILVRPTEQAR
jgi:NADP-dependent 3-hydroxy acid dehydrogenase YdfG